MTCKEFEHLFWYPFIRIEKEFMRTMPYVELNEQNFNTFSTIYQNIIRICGNEIDSAFKCYCQLLDDNFKKNSPKMKDYEAVIHKKAPEFVNTKVLCILSDIVLDNWEQWRDPSASNNHNAKWWTVYNNLKHDRTGYTEINIEEGQKANYQFGNLEYTIRSMAVLFQILIYSYRCLAEKEEQNNITPLPGSKMFRLSGKEWDDIQFYFEDYFETRDDHLFWVSSAIPYDAI